MAKSSRFHPEKLPIPGTLYLLIFLVHACVAATVDDTWHFHTIQQLNGKERMVRLWLPEKAQHIRGLLLAQDNWAESAFVRDAKVRDALAAASLGLIYFQSGSLRSDFNPQAQSDLIAVLATFSQASGVAELASAPLLPFGHSALGPLAQNIGIKWPERTIAVIHYKSGNLLNSLPADSDASALADVPFLSINGQFEEFGPNGTPSPSWEDQWLGVRADLLQWRSLGDGLPVAQLVEPGSGHFAWTGRITEPVIAFIREACDLRIPEHFEQDQPVVLNPLSSEDGWLTASHPYHPESTIPAPVADYAGDPAQAWWHPGPDTAAAWMQSLVDAFPPDPDLGSTVKIAFNNAATNVFDTLDFAQIIDYTSATITVSANSIDDLPVLFQMEHGAGYQVSPNQFKINAGQLRVSGITPDGMRYSILGFQEATATQRYGEKTARINLPTRTGTAQTITFDPIADVTWPCEPIPLSANSSSALPVDLYVVSGPARIENGQLIILPRPASVTTATVEVTLNAGQFGDTTFATAAEVSRSFSVTYPYTAWIESRAPTLPPHLRNWNDSPNNNGATNLERYYFDLDLPSGKTPTSAISLSLAEGLPSLNVLKNPQTPELTQFIQFAEDLSGTWITLREGINYQVVNIPPQPGESRESLNFNLTHPITTGFLRLVIAPNY